MTQQELVTIWDRKNHFAEKYYKIKRVLKFRKFNCYIFCFIYKSRFFSGKIGKHAKNRA